MKINSGFALFYPIGLPERAGMNKDREQVHQGREC